MKIKIALLAGVTLAAAMVGQAQALGFASYFAIVGGGGGIARSSGVASASHPNTGRYEVTFNRAINGCALMTNVNGATPGYGVTRVKPGDKFVLQVFIFSRTGAHANLPFTVLVTCNS